MPSVNPLDHPLCPSIVIPGRISLPPKALRGRITVAIGPAQVACEPPQICPIREYTATPPKPPTLAPNDYLSPPAAKEVRMNSSPLITD